MCYNLSAKIGYSLVFFAFDILVGFITGLLVPRVGGKSYVFIKASGESTVICQTDPKIYLYQQPKYAVLDLYVIWGKSRLQFSFPNLVFLA